MIRSIAWSPDQQRAASASYDRTVRVWDIDSGGCLGVFEGHEVGVVNAVWSRDGRHLHSCDCEGGIRAWGVNAR